MHLDQHEEAASTLEHLSFLTREQDSKDPEAYEQALRALRIYCEAGKREAYLSTYHREILRTDIPTDSDLTSLEHFVRDLPAFVRALPDDLVLEGVTLHAKMMLDKLPTPIARRTFVRVGEVLSKAQDLEKSKALRAALAILLNFPSRTLSLKDIALTAQKVSERLPGITLRLHSDGAAHWAVSLDFTTPVIITISQLDDRDDTAAVCFALALFLKSYARQIQHEVLITSHLPRVEVTIQVVNEDELRTNVDVSNIGLPERLEQWCMVSRATDPKRDPRVPIIVITGNDIAEHWKLGLGQGGAAQVLFAKTLGELIFHLFEGEIDLETLYPKVIAVVKETIR